MRQQMAPQNDRPQGHVNPDPVSAMKQSSPERRSNTDAISGPRPGGSGIENVELSSRMTSK